MKAIVIEQFGGPQKMQLRDVEIPMPKASQVLVKVNAAGVNFMDIGTRMGQLSAFASPPLTPGVEGAGVIIEVGAAVTDFQQGDRVAWVFAWGSYAEYVLVEAAALVKIPPEIDDQTAAAVMMQGITASHFGTDFYPVEPGEVALVHAAAGGLGGLLTQIIKIRGGTVIGRVSSENKVAAAKAAGADQVIVSKKGFAPEVLELTHGRGVDVVYDGSGPETFADSLAVLKTGGTFCWYGPVLAGRGPIELMSLPKSIKIGYAVFSDHIPDSAALKRVTSQLFDWIIQGRLKLNIYKTYPLSAAASAHQDIEARASEGKLLLLP